MSWFYWCYVDQPSRTADANMLENLHLLICMVIILPDKHKKDQGLTFQASFFNFSGVDTFESINKHSSNLRKYLFVFDFGITFSHAGWAVVVFYYLSLHWPNEIVFIRPLIN